ncbi:Cystathionine gamma-lyase (Gamma-cystathionase) [Durusdinium trenchii]|uniref:cystathionine gamma-lyase n=1 Tax=Durusdinium trenchii TaxID=1381693 RepID=A0ABP0IJL5_9DINO
MEGKEERVHAELATRFVHAGNEPEPRTGAVTTPISLATTFAQAAPSVLAEAGFEYSRTGNPTRQALQESLAAAEGARFCVALSSGCAALVTLVHALLRTGEKIVCIEDVYGGTQRYLRKCVVPTYGMEVEFVDFKDEAKLTKACQGAKLVWLETPTNPTLEVSDIAAVAKIAKAAGATLAVDNTFLSPFLQRPIELGADVVVHSCTKSINGHSDVVMGAICLNDEELHKELLFHQNTLGAVPSPFDCYMCQRGLKTLHVRMERSNQNAAAVAEFLEKDPRVAKVNWPGLPSHPQFAIAQKQQSGGGMIITFWLNPGPDGDKRKASTIFLSSLKLFVCAESLGAVESLIELPSIMTHGSVPEEKRIQLGIDDAMVRVSVGIEAASDLIQDLDQLGADVVYRVHAQRLAEPCAAQCLRRDSIEDDDEEEAQVAGGEPQGSWLQCELACNALEPVGATAVLETQGRTAILWVSDAFADTKHSRAALHDVAKHVDDLVDAKSRTTILLYAYAGWMPADPQVVSWWIQQHRSSGPRTWQAAPASFGGWGRATLSLVEDGEILLDVFDVVHSSKHQHLFTVAEEEAEDLVLAWRSRLDEFARTRDVEGALAFAFASLESRLNMEDQGEEEDLLPLKFCLRIAQVVLGGSQALKQAIKEEEGHLLDVIAHWCEDLDEDETDFLRHHSGDVDYERFAKMARDMHLLPSSFGATSIWELTKGAWRNLVEMHPHGSRLPVVIMASLVPVYTGGIVNGAGVGERHNALLLSLCFHNDTIPARMNLDQRFTIRSHALQLKQRVNSDHVWTLIPCGEDVQG